ncbi:MAG: hypothetical protein HY328_18170 [Chloroflexi bacterium]|nr:hypothetical protein [Chloroflexota bacterium]
MATVSIDQQLAAAQLALSNARTDADLSGPLADLGYDAARLDEGWGLYQAAVAAQQRQSQEYGEQYSASDAFGAAWEAAQADYSRYVKVARIALKGERGASAALDLDGPRKRPLAGWLAQARQFYTNALADESVLAALTRFGVSQEKLVAGQTQVAVVEGLAATQKKETGEAQQATQDRDAALEALDEWMGDFLAIARIALEENPQWLEKMGVLARS